MRALADIAPDFVFYSDVYHGHKLDEGTFENVLSDSVAEVDARMRDDATLDDSIVERVKMAVCSICEAAGSTASRLHSYTSGKTSETFDAPPFSMSAEAAVKRYLGNCGVLKGGRWL